MTIRHTKKEMSGQKLDGYEITCCKCPLTSFIHSAKHLPPEVVTKKFQDRRWEVNKGPDDDLCPTCVESKRPRMRRKTGQAALAERLQPSKEQLPLCAASIGRVITEEGLMGALVVALEGKRPKFEIEFTQVEIGIGRINHIEREIVDRCKADLAQSYLKNKLTHVNGGATVNVTAKMVWVLALDPTSEAILPV